MIHDPRDRPFMHRFDIAVQQVSAAVKSMVDIGIKGLNLGTIGLDISALVGSYLLDYY